MNKDFFEEKLEYINTDKRAITPDPKFTLLHLGIQSYFETYSSIETNRFPSYLIGSKLKVCIDHEYVLKNYASIQYIHLFFEQFISEILSDISPLLVYGKFNKDLDLVNALTNNFDLLPKGNRKLSYGQLLNRICHLIQYDQSLNEKFKIPEEYHFINSYKSQLEILANQRNEIMHNADKILPMYIYELLMVNNIIPIINEVDKGQSGNLLRENYSDILILDELIRFELPENIEEIDKGTIRDLHHINHLKELGRASIVNKLYMGKVSPSDSLHTHYNLPIIQLAESEAKFKKENIKDVFEVYKCPCCGCNSMITMKIFYTLKTQSYGPKVAKCTQCTYSICAEIGEPSEFNLASDKLFIEIKE